MTVFSKKNLALLIIMALATLASAHSFAQENGTPAERTTFEVNGTKIEITSGQFTEGQEQALIEGLAQDAEQNSSSRVDIEVATIVDETTLSESNSKKSFNLVRTSQKFISELEQRGHTITRHMTLGLKLSDVAGLEQLELAMNPESKKRPNFFRSAVKQFDGAMAKLPTHHWLTVRTVVPGVATAVTYYFVKHYSVALSIGGVISTASGSLAAAAFNKQINTFQMKARVWGKSSKLQRWVEQGKSEGKIVQTSLEKAHSLFNFGIAEAAFGAILYYAEQGYRMGIGAGMDHFDASDFWSGVGISTLSQGMCEDALGNLREIMKLQGMEKSKADAIYTRLSAYASLASVIGFKVSQSVHYSAGVTILGVLGAAGFVANQALKVPLRELQKAQEIKLKAQCENNMNQFSFLPSITIERAA